MIRRAMDVTLNVKPLMGILVHTDFWEGPCRAGIREEMMPDAERRTAREKFEKCKEVLEHLIPQVRVLEPVFFPYTESFLQEEEIVKEVNKEINETDCIMILNQRIPKIERFGKPVISYTHAVSGADVSAYLRSIGREAYYAIDLPELNDLLHMLWVRKAVNNTRALILTAGEAPTWGLQSNIRDLEKLRAKYGFEVVKKPFTDIFAIMEKINDDEAEAKTKELMENAKENKVAYQYLINDVKYYMAAERMLELYDCNAFSTACVELCRSRIPQEKKFVPCIAHSLFKDRGIPSGCEEDLNALLAMIMMMYTAEKPAFMGNPLFESEEIISLHHSVPCLQMNGFDKPKLNYSIYHFTGQGFGGKLQIDFSQNEDKKVTLGRFDPSGEKLLVTVGDVLSSKYTDTYCSPYYFLQVGDSRKFIHSIMNFGHHPVLIFGDYKKKLKELAWLLDFEVVEGN